MASPFIALAINNAIPQGIFQAPVFIAAAMFTSQVSGPRAAVLALVISSLLLDYYFIPPFGSFEIDRAFLPSVGQFVVPAVIGVWFVEKRKHAETLLAGEAAVARQLQGEKTIEQLGAELLGYFGATLGAPIGAFYTVDAAGVSQRRAGYALDLLTAPPTIAAGDGLIGQAATRRGTVEVAVPPAYLGVKSSLGRARPRHVAVFSAHDGDRAHAVVELGLARRLSRSETELLDRVAEPIAVAVRTASYRERLQTLLVETRRQAEVLKEQDEELRAANEELEERGQALERQNDALAFAQEVVRTKSDTAERANRTKSEFLANMSHELRTPLNSSLILAKLLVENRDGNLTAEQVKFASSIHAAGNELLAMIDDILDLSKIEAGKLDVHIQDVSTARIRAELARTFEPIAKERGLGIATESEDGFPEIVRTDAMRIGQILKNLVSNALKFTEHGRVTVAISSDGRTHRFSVRDTGIGIPADRIELIFEPFRQADGTTNRKYGGTGLGLAISRDLARMLGGEITVESVPDAGSTFTLAVPAALVAPAVRAASRPRGDDEREILIIEDDPRFGTIVVDLARELGFVGSVVASAEEAIRLATERPPKGIVLDMKLPDHSGMFVLEQLKRDPRTRHIPVHVISVADHARAALEAGAVGYLMKPVEREQIKSALRKLEGIFTRRMRRLLVVESDLAQREKIFQLLQGDNLEIVLVGTVADALKQLSDGAFDCIVTDLTLPDASGYELLETMARDPACSFPSVVVYTSTPLTPENEQRLRSYASSIIMKSARSPERLLDEVTLFLHQIESALPLERQRMLMRARHREAIFEDRKVLIVEDDVRNVFALTSALEPKGMRLTIARSGLEALAALEREPGIELVLMDVMMPEMDGLAATRAIRAQPRFADLPIIALTAKAMADDHERCLQAGANDYMAKPLDVERLLSLLRVWIAK